MNRIIFALSLLMLSLCMAAGTTIFVLSTYTSLPTTPPSLTEIIERLTPVTVSITGTLADESMAATRSGTGIIVRSDGVILTNKHLISEGFRYSIELHDGTKISAKLLKTHPTRDLALLSLESDVPLSLPVGICINSQANVHQGERVVAIGNTLGLYPNSISEGILSGMNRVVLFNGVTMSGLLQTSIPMTVGNSGGPLINQDGKIIGINTGIVGASSQIGWAIPLTQEAVDDFLKNT